MEHNKEKIGTEKLGAQAVGITDLTDYQKDWYDNLFRF